MSAESTATSATLIESIKNADDHESWRRFAKLYGSLILRFALSARLSYSEAEEVVQDVLISVARNIGGFQYQPEKTKFRSWLSRAIRWRISGQQRKQLKQTRFVSGESDEIEKWEELPANDPSVYELLDTAWTEEIIKTALTRVKQSADPKHYQIFYLYVVKNRSVAKVCEQLKVSPAQVYLTKFRMTRLVEKELKSIAAEIAREDGKRREKGH